MASWSRALYKRRIVSWSVVRSHLTAVGYWGAVISLLKYHCWVKWFLNSQWPSMLRLPFHLDRIKYLILYLSLSPLRPVWHYSGFSLRHCYGVVPHTSGEYPGGCVKDKPPASGKIKYVWKVCKRRVGGGDTLRMRRRLVCHPEVPQ